MPALFLLFIVVPVLELWLLIKVGSRIGALPTIGLVILTAFIGVTLLRRQGLSTLMRARQRINSGEIPATEMGEGLCLAVGGALLLTPGFITDTVGFACLIPAVRRRLIRRVFKHVKVMQFGPRDPFAAGPTDQRRMKGGSQGRKSHTTIEGEYRRDDS